MLNLHDIIMGKSNYTVILILQHDYICDPVWPWTSDWSMASQRLLSFVNQKKVTNASIIKMGLSGDLLGGFRGIPTIEVTKVA